MPVTNPFSGLGNPTPDTIFGYEAIPPTLAWTNPGPLHPVAMGPPGRNSSPGSPGRATHPLPGISQCCLQQGSGRHPRHRTDPNRWPDGTGLGPLPRSGVRRTRDPARERIPRVHAIRSHHPMVPICRRRGVSRGSPIESDPGAILVPHRSQRSGDKSSPGRADPIGTSKTDAPVQSGSSTHANANVASSRSSDSNGATGKIVVAFPGSFANFRGLRSG